ncbi:MAG TPA: DUF6567 family protein [Bacteroidota bacterium]|nr:DUF6567 family protein [Bacteroidota bacterium]
MKHIRSLLPFAAALLFLTVSGCASGGMFNAGNITDVQLQRNNFRIVASGVSGESKCGYLFGVSMSMGAATNTFALVRIDGTGMLYKEALENLWKNYEEAHGSIHGKKLALVNVRYDADVLNLLVYTQPKIMIRADVIEFTD